MFTTHGHTAVSGPSALLERLCAHLAEHDIAVVVGNGAAQITLGGAQADISVTDGGLAATIVAPDLAGLRTLRAAVASHIEEFAEKGPAPLIAWRGDGAGVSAPPDFRLLTVARTEIITPHMRRIHFFGEQLGRFDSLEALHVRLFIPPDGVEAPAWPLADENGRLLEQPADRKPAIRKYTIRAIDVAAGTLAIDFVLHDDAGPGSAFAARARRGDVIGMAGPGGRGLRPAGRYIFLTDETGLPAVGRMLAALPASAMGHVIAEVASVAEEQTLEAPEGVSVTWLHRGADGATELPAAFETLSWPEDGVEAYVWAACEHEAVRRIRSLAKARLRSGRDQHLIVSYWRAGLAEEQHAARKQEEKTAPAA